MSLPSTPLLIFSNLTVLTIGASWLLVSQILVKSVKKLLRKRDLYCIILTLASILAFVYQFLQWFEQFPVEKDCTVMIRLYPFFYHTFFSVITWFYVKKAQVVQVNNKVAKYIRLMYIIPIYLEFNYIVEAVSNKGYVLDYLICGGLFNMWTIWALLGTSMIGSGLTCLVFLIPFLRIRLVTNKRILKYARLNLVLAFTSMMLTSMTVVFTIYPVLSIYINAIYAVDVSGNLLCIYLMQLNSESSTESEYIRTIHIIKTHETPCEADITKQYQETMSSTDKMVDTLPLEGMPLP